MEGNGPVDGTPVDIQVAISSADPLKADGAGARLIGFSPEDIGYLYYLEKEGWGDYSLKGLIGDDLDKHKKTFTPHATIDIQKQWRISL